MGNGFPTVRAVVDSHAKAALCNALTAGDFSGSEQEMAQGGCILSGGGSNARDRFAGDDENMDGGLRRYIPEGDADVIFMDDVGRDFLVTDLLEQRLVSHQDQTWHFAGSLASPTVGDQGHPRME